MLLNISSTIAHILTRPALVSDFNVFPDVGARVHLEEGVGRDLQTTLLLVLAVSHHALQDLVLSWAVRILR